MVVSSEAGRNTAFGDIALSEKACLAGKRAESIIDAVEKAAVDNVTLSHPQFKESSCRSSDILKILEHALGILL